jgi:hypothetical protein
MIWALTMILPFGVLPLVSLLLAVLVASPLGCALDEGSVHPRAIFGLDVGALLYRWRSAAGSSCSRYRSPDWR